MHDAEGKVLPRHIGFIIDGNRRWAIERNLKSYEGHYAGYEAVKEVLVGVLQSGVRYVSCYVFSTENWSRPKTEIDKYMALVMHVLTKDVHYFNENNARVRVLGLRDQLKPKMIKAIESAEYITSGNTGGELLLCLNYGGHQEIAEACKKIVQSGIKTEDITPELLEQNMYAPDVPPCDLIVRTSGEQRLSGFMLWRAAYSELLFMDKYWPDMTKEDVTFILEEYEKRNRRFGG